MARHGHGRSIVDAYFNIEQRIGTCNKCGTQYTGPKVNLRCIGCGNEMVTRDIKSVKKVPTGIWNVTTLRKKRPEAEDDNE